MDSHWQYSDWCVMVTKTCMAACSITEISKGYVFNRAQVTEYPPENIQHIRTEVPFATPQRLHGAEILTSHLNQLTISPSFVARYTSTMVRNKSYGNAYFLIVKPIIKRYGYETIPLFFRFSHSYSPEISAVSLVNPKGACRVPSEVSCGMSTALLRVNISKNMKNPKLFMAKSTIFYGNVQSGNLTQPFILNCRIKNGDLPQLCKPTKIGLTYGRYLQSSSVPESWPLNEL